MAVGELQSRVGENLRRYRLERGLSQEVFAEKLGVHRTYMGGVERGERNLTLKSLESIAERLGLDPLMLLTPPGEHSIHSTRPDLAQPSAHGAVLELDAESTSHLPAADP